MRKALQFALATATLRVVHALLSIAWHVDGDIGLPWLMANDWDWTPHRRFFWGQDYLGTYETFVLAKIGHLFWPGTIPEVFNVIVGQLLYVAGATALFAALRKMKSGFGDRWWEFTAAIVLLGFAVPSMAKFSFSVGTGYSLTPLAVGWTVWLWASEAASPALFLAGCFVGFAQTVLRLNLIPALAVSVCLACAFLRNRSIPRPGRRWILYAAGIGLGTLPELLAGPVSEPHSSLALFPLIERWHRLSSSLTLSGAAFGTLPYAVTRPEDNLFFRGHAPEFPHLLLDLLSALILVALTFARRGDRERPRVWILWAIVVTNVALVTLSASPNSIYSARRYDFPMLLSLSALVLLSLDSWWGKALAGVRAAILAIYLWASVAYSSPLTEIHSRLLSNGFDPSQDCLSGSGGDLTTVQAQASVLYRVISYRWRLAGNDSRALFPDDRVGISEQCRAIFHIDTGEVPISEAAPYCQNPRLVFAEAGRPEFRAPVKLFACSIKQP